MRFAVFPPHLSKVLRLPRKSDARSYEVLRLSRKIIFPKLKIWCSKMQPLSGNQRPDLLTALMNMSLVLRLARDMHLAPSSSNVSRLPSFLKLLQNPHVLLTFDTMHNPLHLPREMTSECPKCSEPVSFFFTFDLEMCFAPQRRALFRHLNFQKCSEHDVFCTFCLGNVLHATTACTFSTSPLPKVVRTWGVLCILTWKCASRHNGVHFFDISTSKSVPNMMCFVHFDLEMCFTPQRRALFRHLNFQKWSEHEVFCAFWLGNVLHATTACTFSTSQLPKAVRTWGVLCILTWKCASCHNGVHFFDIAASKRAEAEVFCAFWLGNVLRATTACNFSSLIWPAGSAPAALASLLFDPPEPQIISKTQCFATFLPFRAPGSSFFWDFVSCDLLSSSLLHSSPLLSSALLCSSLLFSSILWLFPSLLFICPYCRKFDF